jgi:2-polyprenyl-6-methoxyphenol hydroxylase-like FAD-dependent oxidoreductase
MKRTYDVIISGAGPVGLFLACELALQRCSVLILEKARTSASPLKRLPFGIRGLSSSTIEALDRRDLLEELEIHEHVKNPHTATTAERQVGHFAGIPLFENKIDPAQWKYRLPTSTPVNLISEIEELETILTRRARSLGVEIQYDHGVTSLEETHDDVSVQAGKAVLKAQWLVGCDGARSIVRKLGGFEFVGTEPEFTGYTTQIELHDPEKLKEGRVITSQGMYMQSRPGYVIIQDFDKGAFHDSKEPITIEHLQGVLRRITETDVTIKTLYLATTWTDRARQATRYRRGRILLAGDAAHIHSPLGGQGLNLGIGDAMNLGWKLAAMIHKYAPETLLDSYQSERHPVGEQVLNWSRAQVALMKTDAHTRALYSILRDLIQTTDGTTYIAGRLWGIPAQLEGRSVPNFQLSDGHTLGERLRGGKWILIDFTSCEALKKLSEKYQGHLEYISSLPQETFGLEALLIRPDGVIAETAIIRMHGFLADSYLSAP